MAGTEVWMLKYIQNFDKILQFQVLGFQMLAEDIEKKITEQRNNLKTDRLDMSFGEILNLFDEEAFIINPEFQRLFRWDIDQQTRFVESILLGIPIPPIFVAEDQDGKWELVDGLQRISTVLSFFGKLPLDEKNNLKLSSGELLNDSIKDVTIKDLSLKLQHTIKRSVCRVEILRWDSDIDMRYELFNRLNTGSSPLTAQELRNCIYIGEFNTMIRRLASNSSFIELLSLSTKRNEEMYHEELILRFFANKLSDRIIRKNLQYYLDSFIQKVHKSEIEINYQEEERNFEKLVSYMSANCSQEIFKAENKRFSANHFEAIFYALDMYYDQYKDFPDLFNAKILELKEDDEYKVANDSSTGLQYRTKNKLDRVKKVFSND